MGMFDWLFKKEEPRPLARGKEQFKLLTAYEPVFRDYYGSLYEVALVRSAIEAKARHISKLKVELQGEAKPALKRRMKYAPNPWQTWPQFLARCSTILDCTNNLFIVPVMNDTYETIGFFPVLPDQVELLEDKNKTLWLKYTFRNNMTGVVEFERCAYLNKHQYKSDFWGESNKALRPTMSLIAVQEQGIKEAVKNSASYRFTAQMTNFMAPEDLAKERSRFTTENLSSEASGGGLLLFPNTYKDIKQVNSTPYVVDKDQMNLINSNVFNYFGVNEKIMQSTANSEELDAFFNSEIETFSIALAEAMSRAIYSMKERTYGNHVYVSANRLQYMSTSVKVQVAKELGDRGDLTIDEIRELFNYPPLPNGAGNVAYIRGEFKPVESVNITEVDDGQDED